MKLVIFITILFTLSYSTVSKPAEPKKDKSNIVLDTLFETIAFRNTDFNSLIDSCMIYSDYLEKPATHNTRKIIYRDVKAMVTTSFSGKQDTLTAKVCFTPNGIAIQAFNIKSTFTEKQTKNFLVGLMKYKGEPLKNPPSLCPQCSLFTIRSTVK